MHQKGRSMVEMLGVLAIIGVLSVGALAGFNQAMFKHKLNRNLEAMTLLIANAVQLTQKLEISDSNLTPMLNKVSLISDGLVFKSNKIYDEFQNYYILYSVSNYAHYGYHFGMKVYLNNNETSFYTCRNLILAAASMHSELDLIRREDTKNDTRIGTNLYGLRRCRPTSKCLANLTMRDIDNFCRIEQSHNDLGYYTFFILWD